MYCQARVDAPFGNDGEFTARGWSVRSGFATSQALHNDYYTYRYPVRLSLGLQISKGESLQTLIIHLEASGEQQQHGTP